MLVNHIKGTLSHFISCYRHRTDNYRFFHKFKMTGKPVLVVVWISLGLVSISLQAMPGMHAAKQSVEAFSINDRAVIKPGQTLSLAAILQHENDARVILVGEQHTRVDHHQVQFEIMRYMHEHDIDLAVGLEWFQQPFQSHLNDFLAGNITEKQLLNRTEYFDRWAYDYRLYQPILLYAREHGIPLLALNADRELSKVVTKKRFEELADELKQQLPSSFDWSDKAYEKRLEKIFKMHPDFPGTFEGFLRGQLLWDETMAENAADYLKEHPQKRMLVFAGSGHIEFGSGIPNRIKRRIKEKVITILPSESPAGVKPGKADYLVFSQMNLLPNVGLIGAFLETSGDAVVI
ncbi:MAG: ChaN family lipoprotein, partial [Gammaproteobacteria bacterium]|nr:ChaN family lipoprotein [Gammaproteobacteria bacterium]